MIAHPPPFVVPMLGTDRDWVMALWKSLRVLGKDPGAVWYRWMANHDNRERWVGVREVAFAHFRYCRDNTTTLYELAVHPEARRLHYGTALIHFMGPRIRLKTDRENIEANEFYRKLGFTLYGETRNPAGRVFHHWGLP